MEAKEALIARLKSEHEASLASLEQSICDAKSGGASEVEAKLRVAEERHASELASREHEIDEMKRLWEQDTTKMESLSASLEASKLSGSEAQAELGKLRTDRAELEEKLKTSLDEANTLKSETQVQKKESEEQLKEIQRQREEDLAKIESLSKSLDEVRHKCTEFENKLEKVNDESRDLEGQLKDKSEEADRLKSDLLLADKNMSSELAIKVQEMVEVKRQRDENLAKIDSLNKSLDEAKQKCSESQDKLENACNESRNLEGQLKAKSEEAADLESKLRLADEKLSSELAVKSGEMDDVKMQREQDLAKIDALAKSLESAEQRSSDLQHEVGTLGEKCGSLESDLKDKEGEAAALKKDLDDLRGSLEQAEEAKSSLDRQVLSKDEEVLRLREELDSRSKGAENSEQLLRSAAAAKESELAEKLAAAQGGNSIGFLATKVAPIPAPKPPFLNLEQGATFQKDTCINFQNRPNRTCVGHNFCL